MSKRTIERRPAKKGSGRPVARKQGVSGIDGDDNSWQEMYIITERWQSDLAFFNDELSFFRKLINKYLLWLVDEKNIEHTRKLAADISKFDKRGVTVSQKLATHLRELANLAENPFSHNAQSCRDAHGALESIVAELAKDFRSLKKKVFRVTETVIDSEKANRLLNGQ